MRLFQLFCVALVTCFVSSASATPGNEIALVLDNSCSMAFPATDQNGTQYPPNDPERAAVLGALVVEGLVRGSNDRLTVYAFPDVRGGPPRTVRDAAGIRGLPYANHTLFTEPLQAARAHLDASTRDGKLLLFFSDGVPEDLPQGGPDAAGVFGMDTAGDIDTFILGLYGSEDVRDMAVTHVSGLARSPDDSAFMDDPAEVVPAFTKAYARALGSKPQTGSLSSGDSVSFDVGKYVTEVLVFVASQEQGAAFQSTLTGPNGAAPVQAQGNDGCEPALAAQVPPNVCGGDRRHYQVFRAPSDPLTASTWSLAVTGPNVRYGVILRYDLTASLALDPTVRVGSTLPVEARLLFRGDTFDDDDFFASDGFSATAEIDGISIPLTHAGDGRFVGEWAPQTPTQGAVLATVHFQNTWMQQRDTKQVTAEGFLPLVLRPTPIPVRLGNWRGSRVRTERCSTVSLVGSDHADVVPVTCIPGTVEGATVTCTPQAPQGTAQPLEWDVCVVADACCGEIPADGSSVDITFRGTHDHYAAGAVKVPVEVHVERTGFIRCWWLPIAIAATVLFVLWVIVGWIRPNSFDPYLSVRIAGDEKGLKRTVALVLQEQPGGRRGFYRNARLCIDGEGNCVRKTRVAQIVITASGTGEMTWAKSGGVEKKDRRTRKWTSITQEELREGVIPGVVYRAGGLHLKFG